jgi:hypothetical protein
VASTPQPPDGRGATGSGGCPVAELLVGPAATDVVVVVVEVDVAAGTVVGAAVAGALDVDDAGTAVDAVSSSPEQAAPPNNTTIATSVPTRIATAWHDAGRRAHRTETAAERYVPPD